MTELFILGRPNSRHSLLAEIRVECKICTSMVTISESSHLGVLKNKKIDIFFGDQKSYGSSLTFFVDLWKSMVTMLVPFFIQLSFSQTVH